MTAETMFFVAAIVMLCVLAVDRLTYITDGGKRIANTVLASVLLLAVLIWAARLLFYRSLA